MTEIPQYYMNPQEPTEELDNDEKNGLKKTVLYEYNPDLQGNPIGEVKRYLATANDKYAITSTIISGTNTSSKKQLTDMMGKLKNGPYTAHGKNNSLHIHNTKAKAKIAAKYKYNGGNGELLSFNIDGDYITTMVEVAKTTQIDPKDKSVVTKILQTLSNPDGSFKTKVLSPTAPNLLTFKSNISAAIDNTYHKPVPPNNNNDLYDQILNQQKETTYKSADDAWSDIRDNYEVTSEDVDKYLQQLQDSFEKRQNPSNIQGGNEYRDLLKNPQVFEPYLITKKVKIRRFVEPIELLPGGNPVLLKKREESKEGLNVGFKRLHNDKYKQQWEEGYRHLREDPNIKILTKGEIKWGDKIEIEEVKEMGIPISGVRILASQNLIGFGQTQANNSIKSIHNQVKANATVLGRPALTCSINVHVDGIGSKYSGVWYIKKVKHSIDSQGYTCDIDFRQRNIPIHKQVIKTSINTQKAYRNLNELAKKSEKTGWWMYPSLLQVSIEKWRNDPTTPNKNYLIVQDKNDLSKGNIYSADSDFKTNKFDNVTPKPTAEINIPATNYGGIDDE